MLNHCIIAGFLLLLSLSLSGDDQHAIDSLVLIIEKSKQDTSIASAYIALSDILYIANPDTLLPLCTKAAEIAEKNLANNPSAILKRKFLSIKSGAFNNIGYVYLIHGDIDKSLQYFQNGLKIRKEIGDKYGQAESLNNIGYIYHIQGDVTKSLEYYLESLSIKEGLGDDKGVATSLNNIANIYRGQGEIDKSLEFFYRSLEKDSANGDKKGVATALNNIGSIYESQGDIGKGLEYLHEGLNIYEELKDNRGAGATLNNIGFIYQNQGDYTAAMKFYTAGLTQYEIVDDKSGIAYCIGNIASVHKNQGDITTALDLYFKALKMQQELDFQVGIANTLTNIGGMYKNFGDPLCTLSQLECDKKAKDRALEYYHKSLEIQEAVGDKPGMATSLISIANLHFDRGDEALAKEFASKSMVMANKIKYPKDIREAAWVLSRIDKSQGNFKEALKMYELYIQMRDSIKNEETQKSAIRQQTKYEFEKAQLVKDQEEKDNIRLEQEVTKRRDNLQYSVIFIAILVLFGGVLSLGYVNVSERMAEGIIFFSFLILFEFVLVLADPYIDRWSGGAPGIKLLFNAGIAALIFPAHAFFESKLKRRLVKSNVEIS